MNMLSAGSWFQLPLVMRRSELNDVLFHSQKYSSHPRIVDKKVFLHSFSTKLKRLPSNNHQPAII